MVFGFLWSHWWIKTPVGGLSCLDNTLDHSLSCRPHPLSAPRTRSHSPLYFIHSQGGDDDDGALPGTALGFEETQICFFSFREEKSDMMVRMNYDGHLLI